MKLFLILILFFGYFLSLTNTIRCYKCDATDECKMINNDLKWIKSRESSENVEIVDCEHYCWKSISLGNVYRGCAKKRCSVSHTLGTFSSSVCCQKDYCNQSNRLVLSKFFYMIIVIFLIKLHH